MKGHIRERSPGRWAIILDDRQTGRRKRVWRTFLGNKRQAQIECARLIAQLQNGSAIEPNKLTVSIFLDRWLDYIRPMVSPKTLERYESIVRVNIKPAIGSIKLTRLQPMQISAAYSSALARLAPRTVNHIHRTLSQP
jgi:hypothetical protein